MTAAAAPPVLKGGPPDVSALRAEVRGFVEEWWDAHGHTPGLGMNAVHDPAFSRALASRGWVGMMIPAEYGGSGASAVERFVVAEELLSAGAPVAAHWVAERQTAPTLLAFGTESQRRRFLPEIARGECFFSIGLSEPGAGSDLAAVATTATRTEGGWLVNGTKIWTSNAHRNHWFVVLCRSSPRGEDRHEGLTQLIVDLSSPGLRISPIPMLNGSHHFNEVALEDVFVPEDMILGTEGSGWHQISSELAHERSGPDRFMSTFPLLVEYLRAGTDPDDVRAVCEVVGGLAARFWAIRQMSLAVAEAVDEGRPTGAMAATVKDLGTTFEQEVVAAISSLVELDPDPGAASLFERMLADATLVGPSYTIRGGTTEVLRSVAARALKGV